MSASPLNRRLQMDHAVGCLQAGGVVVFPTDTLYGLGADVFNETALRRVFEYAPQAPVLSALSIPACLAESSGETYQLTRAEP